MPGSHSGKSQRDKCELPHLLPSSLTPFRPLLRLYYLVLVSTCEPSPTTPKISFLLPTAPQPGQTHRGSMEALSTRHHTKLPYTPHFTPAAILGIYLLPLHGEGASKKTQTQSVFMSGQRLAQTPTLSGSRVDHAFVCSLQYDVPCV